jgi:hypothetical protein
MGRREPFIKTLAERTIERTTPADLAIYSSAQHLHTSNSLHVVTRHVLRDRLRRLVAVKEEEVWPCCDSADDRNRNFTLSQFKREQFRLLYLREIWGSHGVEGIDAVLLRQNAVRRRNVLLNPWRWRQYVPQKHWYLPTGPHDVKTQQTSIDMKTTPL